MINMNKRVFISLIALVLLVSAGVFVHSVTIFSKGMWDNCVWLRQYMIDDLTEKYDLCGMSRAEIAELLGQNGLVDGSHEIYYVGKTWCGPVLFALSFEDGRVKNFGIIVD